MAVVHFPRAKAERIVQLGKRFELASFLRQLCFSVIAGTT